MSEPVEAAPPAPPSNDNGSTAEELARALGVGLGPAQKLADAGYSSPEVIRGVARETLQELGLSSTDIDRIRGSSDDGGSPSSRTGDPGSGASKTGADDDRILERFASTVRSDKPKRRHVGGRGKDSTDVLKKWVDGDDRAMEAWIQSSDTPRSTPSVPRPVPPQAPPPEVAPDLATQGTAPAPATGPVAPSPAPAFLREREETVVRWLTDLLDRVKSDQFDPTSILQEVQDLQRQLFEERARRKQLEDEVEHVKRGSIAVIKFVRSREAKAREQSIQAKDAEIAELKLRLLAGPGDPSDVGPGPIDATSPSGPTPGVDVQKVTETAIRDTENRLREEFASREHQYIERETELRRRTVQLEGEIRGLRSEADGIQEREAMLKHSPGALPGTITDRMKELETRDKELVLRENELRSKFEEIKIAAEELERTKTPLAFKEKELAAWERQLQTTKQALELEARRIESARVAAEQQGPGLSSEEAKRVEDLRAEVSRKEDELRTREKYLNQQMEEIDDLRRKAAQVEADQMHAEVVADVKEAKVRTGVRRLDDLLFGGLPNGTQVLVNGPTHTGKDVLARLFIAEGLKAGIPALWVVTDKTHTQIREEMTGLYPAYPDAEGKGLVRYVDLYARSLGVTQAGPNVKLLASTDKGFLEQLTTAVNNYSTDLKELAPTYRVVFESVSTLTAYLDTTSTFRFLQPFSGRRKMDGAASYYILETGMHSESDLQTLEHMMDGSVNLKVDQLKTFLSVKGITDVQSRAWIGYTFSKKSFSLGSFSLDHIR